MFLLDTLIAFARAMAVQPLITEAQRRAAGQRLELASGIQLPLPETPASRLLVPYFSRLWAAYLWNLKTKAPKLLLRYTHQGPAAADSYPPAKLTQALDGIEDWIDEGRNGFLTSSASFYWECALYGRSSRKKHWPKPGASRAQVCQASKHTKESIFMSGVEETTILRGFWVAMAVEWGRFSDKMVRRIAVNFSEPVGFTNGAETTYVLYDIDYSAVHVHAYPVSKQEAGLVVSLASAGLSYDQLRAAPTQPTLRVQPDIRRIVYSDKLPSFAEDLFELVDAAALALNRPKTFRIPSQASRQNLVPGDLAKLGFDIRVSKKKRSHERIWIWVIAPIGPSYVGELCNHSDLAYWYNFLKHGDQIAFRQEHVHDILDKSDPRVIALCSVGQD